MIMKYFSPSPHFGLRIMCSKMRDVQSSLPAVAVTAVAAAAAAAAAAEARIIPTMEHHLVYLRYTTLQYTYEWCKLVGGMGIGWMDPDYLHSFLFFFLIPQMLDQYLACW